MFTPKQFTTMNLAQQLQNMAILSFIDAARQSVHWTLAVREQAIISEETRNIAEQMIAAIEQNIFGKLSEDDFDALMLDIIKRIYFIATNATLVATRVNEKNVNPPIAIIGEELRAITEQLRRLYGCATEYEDIPAAYPTSRVISDEIKCLSATSGKYKWYENICYVTEIVAYYPEFIQNGRLVLKNEWRDMDMPFIQLGDATKKAGVAIITDSQDSKKLYAVLVDSQYVIITPVGVNKPCDVDIPVRECWATSAGGEMIFPDWEKII